MSQRYFLTTESAYEALRLALDADLGYPTSAATSIFTPALEAPRDSLRRIVLAVDDSLPHYAEIIAKVEPLLASASAQELTEAEYLAFLVCVSEGGGVPIAHAASHAAGGADELFDQDLNTDDDVTFLGINVQNGGRLVNDQAGAYAVDVGSTGTASGGYITLSGANETTSIEQSVTVNAHGVTFADSSQQTTAYTGKIGTASGLVLKTGTDGVIEALAQGTAGQVLKVNSGATGVEWVTLGGAASLNVGTTAGTVAAGDHTHTQLHDRSHAITSSSDHTATAWRLFYSDGSGVITELTLGSSGQALLSNGASAAPSWGSAGSNSASDLTTGTLANARMTTRARASMNLYLWSSFR